MIDRSHRLPLARQAREVGISRGSVYYLPKPVAAADLAVMRRIDELHMEFPFAGSRMLRDLLRQEDIEIGRQHVATLMKKMAMEAIYRRRNTSKPAPGHEIYPYLLRKLPIVLPNQVWGITSVGLRPPCMTPHIGNSRKQPADDPLICRQSLCRPTRPPLFNEICGPF